MTTGCPRRFVTPSAAARAMRSFAPPGAKGTIRCTGCSGHCARAPSDARQSMKAAVAAFVLDMRFMRFSGNSAAEFRAQLLELAAEHHHIEADRGEGRAPLHVAARRGFIGREDPRALAARADARDRVADRRL